MNPRRSRDKKAFFTDDFSRVLEEQLRATDDFVRQQEAKLDRAAEELESHLQAFAAEFDAQRRDDPELDRLRQLYAGAREEVQALERRCEELARTRRKSAERRGAAGPPFSWEAQKRDMLASLDTDADANDDDDRLTIDGTISITDAVIVEKDRQIADLTRQLEELQVRQVGQGTAEQILVADDVIRAERERLAKLEAELQERRRASEIELSMERAALARERVDLEEAKQTIEHDRRDVPRDMSSGTSKPTRGRWLTRLGLKADEPDDD